MDMDKKLFEVLSKIPLDLGGSNIANTGYDPASDSSLDSAPFMASAIEEYKKKNEKVLFTNVQLVWDSCDCGDGFGCSHPDWVDLVFINSGGEMHKLEYDGESIHIYGKGQVMMPAECTVYDFYRMCELVDIHLELSDYAKSLIQE